MAQQKASSSSSKAPATNKKASSKGKKELKVIPPEQQKISPVRLAIISHIYQEDVHGRESTVASLQGALIEELKAEEETLAFPTPVQYGPCQANEAADRETQLHRAILYAILSDDIRVHDDTTTWAVRFARTTRHIFVWLADVPASILKQKIFSKTKRLRREAQLPSEIPSWDAIRAMLVERRVSFVAFSPSREGLNEVAQFGNGSYGTKLSGTDELTTWTLHPEVQPPSATVPSPIYPLVLAATPTTIHTTPGTVDRKGKRKAEEDADEGHLQYPPSKRPHLEDIINHTDGAPEAAEPLQEVSDTLGGGSLVPNDVPTDTNLDEFFDWQSWDNSVQQDNGEANEILATVASYQSPPNPTDAESDAFSSNFWDVFPAQ